MIDAQHFFDQPIKRDIRTPNQHATFWEYLLSFPSTLQCSRHPGNIKGTF